MARIRLLTTVAGGPCHGNAGDVVDVSDAIAAAWTDAGLAQRVTAPAARKPAAKKAAARKAPAKKAAPVKPAPRKRRTRRKRR